MEVWVKRGAHHGGDGMEVMAFFWSVPGMLLEP